MTTLKWEDIDLGSATLKVAAGKGGKTAWVNLSSTLVEALGQVPLDKRTGYLLPARSRIAVYKRLEAKAAIRIFTRLHYREKAWWRRALSLLLTIVVLSAVVGAASFAVFLWLYYRGVITF